MNKNIPRPIYQPINISKKKLPAKKSTARKKAILTIALVLLLVALLGVGGFMLAKFSAKPGIYIHKNSKGQNVLVVNGRPTIIKGVCYSPIPIGEGHIYNWWGDGQKPWMIDGKLMKEAGINTIRLYEPGGESSQVKTVVSDMYTNYGIYTLMGHGLGFWDYPPANYADPEFRLRIKKEVYKMAKTYKDEPGILAWVLGNEANYSFDGKINPWTTPELDSIESPYDRKMAKAKIYYGFLNELAQIVKKVDPSRPVGFGNGELGSIEMAKEYCPDFDFVGIIIYRGKSFGNLFRELGQKYDKPCIIIEFGCDSYNAKTNMTDEENQAFFLKSLWSEVEENTFLGQGQANCLGGCVFEWNDEWWKGTPEKPEDWETHNTEGTWSNGSYYFDIDAPNNLNMNEEWWGIVSLSQEKEYGVNKRVPKKAYSALKEIWTQNSDKASTYKWR